MEYMSKQEVAKVLEVAMHANRDHHLAILLAYATGARVSQVLTLTGTDVYAAELKIKIHAVKRGRSRFFRLHQDNDNPIWDLTPLVYLATRRGAGLLFGSLTRQYLDLCFKRYGRAAGVHVDLCHMHCLRHSIAMQIWDNTHRLGAISTFLCHRDPSSAFQYLQENDGLLADEAVEAYAF